MPVLGSVCSLRLAVLVLCISVGGLLLDFSVAGDAEPDSASADFLRDAPSEETVESDDFLEGVDLVDSQDPAFQRQEEEDVPSNEEDSDESDEAPEFASVESSRRRMQAFGYGGFYGYGMGYPGYMPYGGYMGGYMRPWSPYMY